MDYSIKIGGEAGQGIQTIGDTLAKVFSRSGYHVFTHQDYESRIRGGHNFFQIRLSDKPLSASRQGIDILVAMDKESIPLHKPELVENGQIIYDALAAGIKEASGMPGNYLNIPFEGIAVKEGGSKIMANTVATGAVLGILGMGLDLFIEIIKETFKKKGEDVVNINIRAAMAGHDYALKACTRCSFSLGRTSYSPLLLISGVEAIGLGAVSSGCKLYSAYPMTPSTGIMNFMADKEKEYGIVVEQAEDEISAINMALGASFAGVRAMTGTAGGGFALMVEGLSLAAMTETPIVIALGQRPAPATGFPTRTEQADLQFALYTAHGEFPRIVLAPGTPEQAFYLVNKAFDLTEKYQVPAIIIFDQYLADSQWTFEGFDSGRIKYTDYRLREDKLNNISEYKRHAFTETGVTPFAIPGASRHLVVTDSDEHDEEGHIVEDVETRIKMVQKRLLRKLPLLRDEISPPILYGDEKPEIVIVGWGSNFGIIKEAVDELAKTKSISMLHFSELFPFPLSNKEAPSPIPLPRVEGARGRVKFDYLSLLNNARLAICVENNATGQFARLMRAETGFEFKYRINRYDGRPFTVDELLKQIEMVLEKNKAS
ncbi:MAG: 2-oxoacid:acceptor oxidoreductase subunit alpha [Nitrospirae bacterium]|nr:2-oxoacid:acceptor oxidoreductase subunit alpha [Nitrospirota bacterium]